MCVPAFFCSFHNQEYSAFARDLPSPTIPVRKFSCDALVEFNVSQLMSNVVILVAKCPVYILPNHLLELQLSDASEGCFCFN